MRIALGGISGSGKDYLAKSLIEKGFVRLSFSDQLKKIACKVFDWLEPDYPPIEKEKVHTFITSLGEEIKMSPREIWLKMNFLRDIENKIFIRHLNNQFKMLKDNNVVITDIRTKDEFEYCKNNSFITIFIEPEKKIYKINDFDKQLYEFKDRFDYNFVNKFNGTEEFVNFVENLR